MEVIDMQFGETFYSEEPTSFVGRDKEMEAMYRHVAGESNWQWFHIYGQSGIGKSSLLRRFKSELEGRYYLFVDGNRGIRHKEDVLDQLAKQLWGGNRDSTERNQDDLVKYILWLRQLSKDVKIISAGRHPLTGGWVRNGWMGLIDSMQLPALTPLDVKQYAQNRGLIDSEVYSQLIRFSGGIPLAMTLAAEVMLRGNSPNRFDRSEQYRLIAVLMDELPSELRPSLSHLIEAASVFWRFNEERLAILIDNETVNEFRKLIQLPFVMLVDGGWMLHDAVRDWVQEDLIRRKPHTYEQMRKKAIQQIRLEERSDPQLRNKLRMEKLFLHEHPIVRNTCFLGYMDDVEVRECQECDLPAIQLLYTRYLNHVLPPVAGECHLEGEKGQSLGAVKHYCTRGLTLLLVINC
jgi:AAA ATPase domain